MRLDPSKEQVKCIIQSLESDINRLEQEIQDQKPVGNIEDVVREALTVKKATLLYLQECYKNNK